MKFKILAVRLSSPFPLQKNLEVGRLYKFTTGTIFRDKNGSTLEKVEEFREITEIRDEGYYPDDLYAVGKGDQKIDINISAILGRNGAGKSSLLEMLYLLIFCLSELKRFVNQRGILSSKISQGLATQQEESYLQILNDLLSGTGIEIYYQIGEEFYLTRNRQQNIGEYKLIDGNWDVVKYNSKLFFYTICVNYSQYGLNSKGEYFWLKSLFHKNDGYRTPIVLNPMRTDGNIDMNVEAHLAQTRILTNLSHQKIATTNLIDNKIINSIKFTVRPALIGNIEENSLQRIYDVTKSQNEVDLILVFTLFLTHFGEANTTSEAASSILYLQDYFGGKFENVNEDKFEQEKEYRFRQARIDELLSLYIVGKMVKICNKYAEFRQHASAYFTDKNELDFWIIKDSKAYVKQLIDDQSHITLKLKQATNALVHGYMDRQEWDPFQDPDFSHSWSYTTTWPFQKMQEVTNAAFNRSKYKKKIRAQFIPAAFFIPTIQVMDGKKTFSFHQLSSGEQQLLHSTHSIIYHILNLDSRKEEKDAYQFVNLILDEIELYYHPKYQRDFIAFLLSKIGSIDFASIKGINIIFSTHSPFILSDIPHYNVLKLEKGVPVDQEIEPKTFGANIHDMLADAFFLEEGLIGKFAEDTINGIIDSIRKINLYKELQKLQKLEDINDQQINVMRELTKTLSTSDGNTLSFEEIKKDEQQTQKIAKLIKLIGEPVIRFKLDEMYHEALGDNQDDKERSRRHILNLMKENNIKREDL